jgi:hypothetical protein
MTYAHVVCEAQPYVSFKYLIIVESIKQAIVDQTEDLTQIDGEFIMSPDNPDTET